MMKKVVVQTSGGYINIPADRMERDPDNNVIYAFCGKELVAVVDIDIIMTMHISSGKEEP